MDAALEHRLGLAADARKLHVRGRGRDLLLVGGLARAQQGQDGETHQGRGGVLAHGFSLIRKTGGPGGARR